MWVNHDFCEQGDLSKSLSEILKILLILKVNMYGTVNIRLIYLKP